MSEELLQRGLDKNNPSERLGKWDYFCIGATTVKTLKQANIIRNIDYKELENKKVDGLVVSRKDVIAIIDATDVLEKEKKRKRFIQLQNTLKNAVMANWENYLFSLIVVEDKYSEMTGGYFGLKKELEE